MSGRSNAVAQSLVPLGVLGVFAGAIVASLTTVRSTDSAARPTEGIPLSVLSAGSAARPRLRNGKLDRATADLAARLASMNADLDRVRADLGEPRPAGSRSAAANPPSIRGVVQSVDGKLNVYVISIGAKDDVRPGMEFDVRRGDSHLGTLIVDGVFESYVTAKRKPGTRAFDVEPGDECTVSPSPR
jgi:hypothetical protein